MTENPSDSRSELMRAKDQVYKEFGQYVGPILSNPESPEYVSLTDWHTLLTSRSRLALTDAVLSPINEDEKPDHMRQKLVQEKIDVEMQMTQYRKRIEYYRNEFSSNDNPYTQTMITLQGIWYPRFRSAQRDMLLGQIQPEYRPTPAMLEARVMSDVALELSSRVKRQTPKPRF